MSRSEYGWKYKGETESMAEMTPMMRKYMETKEQYPDCILFYRLGDFYEMFFEDALTASQIGRAHV